MYNFLVLKLKVDKMIMGVEKKSREKYPMSFMDTT